MERGKSVPIKVEEIKGFEDKTNNNRNHYHTSTQSSINSKDTVGISKKGSPL